MSSQQLSAVLALESDATGVERLRSAFGTSLTVFQSPGGLLAASRNPGIALVIVPWRDRGGATLDTTVAAIRASRASPSVTVYLERTAECLHALVSLSAAGATGVIVRDIDDDVLGLRRLVDRGCLTSAIEAVRSAVVRVVHVRHRPLFLLCLEHIERPPSAVEVARRLRVSRRTLSTWARKAGARGMRSLASKCRVLVAIELIRASSRTLEQVAHELQFASSAHLHNTIRRHTGCTPRGAVAREAFEWCRELFEVPPPPAVLLGKGLRLPRNGREYLTTQHSSHVAGLVPGELTQ